MKLLCAYIALIAIVCVDSLDILKGIWAKPKLLSECADKIREAENRVFGGRLLADILKDHGVEFFNKWLNQLNGIDPSADMDLAELEEYIQLKIEINTKPNNEDLISRIAARGQKFVYRLVRDFLKELKEPFVLPRTAKVMETFFYKDPSNSNRLGAKLTPPLGSEERHMLICEEVHQLYSESPDQYKMYKWLLEFAAKLGGANKHVASVVDLLRMPNNGQFEKFAFEYFLENREYLFFHSDAFWGIIGHCHCRHYAYNLKPFLKPRSKLRERRDIQLCPRAIGIFGQELNLTLRFHSRLSFLWEWLKHADELHEPNEDYSWENFLLLKSSLDKSPNEVIEYADAQELISPIIRAFFKELAEPFFPTFSTRNVNNLPKFSDNFEENKIAVACNNLDNIRRDSAIRYETLKMLIKFATSKGNQEKSAIVLSELMSRPDHQIIIYAHDINFLMAHEADIFRDASPDDSQSQTRCLPKFARDKIRMENRYAKEIRSRPNGIFGQGLSTALHRNTDLTFFFDWLNQIKKLHDLHNLESDLHRYEEYFKLKIEVNVKPTPLPANVDEEFVYRLVRDLIKEETDSSLSILSAAQKAIKDPTSSAEIKVYAVCSCLEDVRKSSNNIIYQMLQKMIEFANRMGGDEKEASIAVSELMAQPDAHANFHPTDVLYLMDNSKRIFTRPMPEDKGYSRCQPPNLRKEEQMDYASLFQLRKNSNGIFGHTLADILKTYPKLEFFFGWLDKLSRPYVFHGDEWDLNKHEQYLQLKAKFNTDPNQAIDGIDEESIYRLLRDFLRNLERPFLFPWTGVSPSLGEAHLFKVCSELEYIRENKSISYQMLKKLIEFASKAEKNAKPIAELISRPPSLVVDEHGVKYLIYSKDRLFGEPTEDDAGISRCHPPHVRRQEQLANKTAREIKNAPNGIFGRPFAAVVAEHRAWQFFSKWLESDKIRQFPPVFNDEFNFGDFEVYVELKKRVNMEPNTSLADASGVHIARLITDYLRELPISPFEEAKHRVFSIVSDASVSYFERDDKPFDLCLRLQALRIQYPIQYQMFRDLIQFSIRMGNMARATAAIGELMGLPKNSRGKTYNIDYFADERRKFFINDHLIIRDDIENECVNHVFGSFSQHQNSYVAYVRYETGDAKTIPDYDQYYVNYLMAARRKNEAQYTQKVRKLMREAPAHYTADGIELSPYF